MIIFDEKRYVEDNLLCDSCRLANNRLKTDAVMLGRYLAHECYDDEYIVSKLKEKIKGTMMEFKLSNNEFMDDLLEKIHQRDLYHDKTVDITESELEYIKKIDNISCERVMFVLLVIKKFFGGQYIKISITELQKLAKLNYNIDYFRQNILKKLVDIGYVVVYATNLYKIKIEESNSSIVMTIDDFDDLMSYYLPTCELKNYFYCTICGRKTKRNSNSQKYCKRCADKVKREKSSKKLKIKKSQKPC